jgi:hypothetical protein
MYSSWDQVGGYFDGDGCVHIRMDSPVVLRLSLVWVDNCYEQLQQLRVFLKPKSIAVGSVLRHSKGAYMLQVVSPSAVLATAKELVDICAKKKKELRIVVNYYESRITGTEALSEFNELVRRKIRLGRIRPLILLPRYGEGKHMVARARGLRRAQITNPKRANLRRLSPQ